MKNKKIGILGVLIILVGLGIFNLFVFLLVSDYTNVFWSAYIFTTIAFVVQGVVGFAFGKADANAKFLSLPLLYVGGIYFAVQLIIGIVCMLAPLSIGFAVLVQAFILAVYIIVILASTIAKEQAIKNDGNIKKVTNYIRTLTIEAEQLYLFQEDLSKKVELKKLYEAIRYSDPMSSTEEIRVVDEQINIAFRVLSEKVSSATADDLKQEIKPILDLVTKRNMICKASK